MSLELMRCPNCAANLTFAAGASITTCSHCGAQVAFQASAVAAASTTLGETIWLKVLPTLAVPLVKTGTPLPASVTETIGSQNDSQPSLHVDLQVGNDSNPAGNRELFSIEYALSAARKRGMPVAQLKIAVDRSGAVVLEVREEGTSNTRTYDGFRAAIR